MRRFLQLFVLGATLATSISICVHLAQSIRQTDHPKTVGEHSVQTAAKKDKPATLQDFRDVISAARSSVVKVEGEACDYISDGTGFIFGQDLVVTNAHAVAGMTSPYVIDSHGKHQATTVFMDPSLDIAVVRVEGLSGQPLKLDTPDTGLAIQGSHYGKQAVILGYPDGGSFQAKLINIGEEYNATIDDIYHKNQTDHDIFAIRTKIIPGSSGSPVVQRDGTVVGIIFAIDPDVPNRGLALPTYAFYRLIENAKQLHEPVTSKCVVSDAN